MSSSATELDVLARGDGSELTTQQAADILNVSHQYLIRLLDEGAVPSTQTGADRRIRVDDLLRYKQQRDRERAEALDELTQLSQEMGGYDELP
jgi:excisionase family DNA binding protein